MLINKPCTPGLKYPIPTPRCYANYEKCEECESCILYVKCLTLSVELALNCPDTLQKRRDSLQEEYREELSLCHEHESNQKG